jgi:DNA-binding transcriptional MerR regulator
LDETMTPSADRGVYSISVAAELVGMGVQTLRLYESRGLLEPARTDGGTRRYSANDLDRLRRIGGLLDAGLNLAGIGMVLDLQDENAVLRAERDGHLRAERDGHLRAQRDGQPRAQRDDHWLRTAPIRPPRRTQRPQAAD